MYPERLLHQQTGAGLPVALFIITVLALLVIGMAQLQESSSKAVSLQIQSQRAFFAAESGVQIRIKAIFDLIDSGGAPSCPSPVTTFSSSGLTGCSATFNCVFDSTNEIFTLTSIGSCGSGSDMASRTVEVRVQ